MTYSGGLRCTCVWDGVRCSRRASEFYSLMDHPYYASFCDPCSHRSRPRGKGALGAAEITEDEAVVRSVMEDETMKRGAG
jgi:hypothetical protein